MASIMTAAVGATNLTALFGQSLSSGADIFFPTDSTWVNETQQRWSDYQAPTYLGAIKPATEEDVQTIVKIAQANGIPFLATGGGHSFSDYSDFEGISIELGNFNTTEFDETETFLTIGGGVKFQDLFDLMYDAGKELPFASCACPGVVGTTLGAGLGPLQGRRGLMIDALESVRLVTADGHLVTVSKTENSDLFWGIRGAGSNFGIVTSATYKPYNITNGGQAMVKQMIFTTAVNNSYFQILKDLDSTLPPEMSLTNVAYWNTDYNMSLLVLNAIYFGTQEEGESYLQAFDDLNPLQSTVVMTPQNELFPNVLGSCTPNQHINIYTVAVTQTDPDTLASILAEFSAMWAKYSGYQGRLLIQRFANDAVLDVSNNETAYPWRDAIAHVSIEGYMTDTSIYEAVNYFERSVRDRLAAVSGYPSLATYSNFARGTEGPESWYSAAKLPRLAALKAQWDPKGLFNFNKPIPTGTSVSCSNSSTSSRNIGQ